MEKINSKLQSDEMDLLMSKIQKNYSFNEYRSSRIKSGSIFISRDSFYSEFHVKFYKDIFESKSKAISVFKDILISKFRNDKFQLHFLPCENFHNLAVLTDLYWSTLGNKLQETIGLSIMNFKSDLFFIICEVYNLHKNNIIHRCINPENILFYSTGRLGIVNFENSLIGNEKIFKLSPSSYEAKFMAPEEFMNRKNVGKASDVWSIGCILLETVSQIPISSRKSSKHFYEIYDTQKEFDEYIIKLFDSFLLWSDAAHSYGFDAQIHELAKDLALKCLRFNPEERITCLEILTHKLFLGFPDVNPMNYAAISYDFTKMKFDEVRNLFKNYFI